MITEKEMTEEVNGGVAPIIFGIALVGFAWGTVKGASVNSSIKRRAGNGSFLFG